MSSSIGDLLIRIKNAYLARHKSLDLPYSTLKEKLAKLLVEKGYLEKVSVISHKQGLKYLKIELKYKNRKAAMTDLKQISKPGRRRYFKVKDFPRLRRTGFGLLVLSTPKGLMTFEEAKKKNIGGELLCQIM